MADAANIVNAHNPITTVQILLFIFFLQFFIWPVELRERSGRAQYTGDARGGIQQFSRIAGRLAISPMVYRCSMSIGLVKSVTRMWRASEGCWARNARYISH